MVLVRQKVSSKVNRWVREVSKQCYYLNVQWEHQKTWTKSLSVSCSPFWALGHTHTSEEIQQVTQIQVTNLHQLTWAGAKGFTGICVPNKLSLSPSLSSSQRLLLLMMSSFVSSKLDALSESEDVEREREREASTSGLKRGLTGSKQERLNASLSQPVHWKLVPAGPDGLFISCLFFEESRAVFCSLFVSSVHRQRTFGSSRSFSFSSSCKSSPASRFQ